ncbi:MAG: ABC transporter substrate-binding protein [Planctomycetota bacterium]|jgi:ABC-type Fe3+ transport system substrate-binding protein
MKALRILPALAAAAGLVWLAWPRGGGDHDDQLRIVSPHWEGIREEFTAAFEEHWREKTGRRVKVVFLDLGGTGKCLRHIRSTPMVERKEDLFFGGGVHSCLGLAKDGLLQPVAIPDEARGAIPEKLGSFLIRDSGDLWFATCLSTFGISYNREVLRRIDAPEPREWEDLTDPRLVGWVGSGNPKFSGAVHMCYEIILQSYGWEEGFGVITRMAGNVRSFTEGSNSIPRDAALGQVAAGGTIDFYALDKVFRLGGESMGYATPARLPVITGDPVALLKGAPNREVAEEFVRFCLSEKGQRLWFLRPGEPGGPREFFLGRIPVRPALCDALDRPNPFKLTGLTGWSGSKAGRRWRIIGDMLHTVMVEPHDDLREAWRALIAAGMPQAELGEFGAPPCSEEEFMRLAAWYGEEKVPAGEKNAQLSEWGTWARKKYARVRARCAARRKESAK